MSAKRGNPLPPAAPGGFGAAILNSYMFGFWLGIGFIISGWLNADLAQQGTGQLARALGLSSPGWIRFWVFLLFLSAMNPVARVSIVYYDFTGRSFVEDRIGFAKAGGQDIGFFSGLLPTACLVVAFASVVPGAVTSWIRGPLLVALSFVIGNVLARMLARRVFTVLFGNAPRVS